MFCHRKLYQFLLEVPQFDAITSVKGNCYFLISDSQITTAIVRVQGLLAKQCSCIYANISPYVGLLEKDDLFLMVECSGGTIKRYLIVNYKA